MSFNENDSSRDTLQLKKKSSTHSLIISAKLFYTIEDLIEYLLFL